MHARTRMHTRKLARSHAHTHLANELFPEQRLKVIGDSKAECEQLYLKLEVEVPYNCFTQTTEVVTSFPCPANPTILTEPGVAFLKTNTDGFCKLHLVVYCEYWFGHRVLVSTEHGVDFRPLLLCLWFSNF